MAGATPPEQQPRGRTTMRDVAALAGVGIKTVSRVINGEPNVSAAKQEAVWAAVAQTGFRRNDSAALLRQGHTSSIGLVLEDAADPFSSALTRSIQDVAHEHGTVLFSASSAEDPVKERDLALAFCARRVDGLIVVPASGSHTYLRPELEAGMACVFVDRPPLGIEADTVLVDNIGGAREGVEQLIRYGHRRIAFVGDRLEIFTARQRLRGYRDALAEAGLDVDPALVYNGLPHHDTTRAWLRDVLASDAPPTGVFCGNSRCTVETLRAIAQSPVRPALVGFDDFELADLLVPAVTVVAQDPFGIGRTAAQLLFRRLEGDTTPVQHIHMRTRLVPRGSGEIRP
ncbi:substrate-binding domain-containing protein [Streptomyces sp. SID3343]|nr:LacI family DNA-binding transcriptional regulator [Streptomyces sp. SID3343]MYW05553.1 substrate-binding domain-containing protein [Streptomyces sp. SID3343]